MACLLSLSLLYDYFMISLFVNLAVTTELNQEASPHRTRSFLDNNLTNGNTHPLFVGYYVEVKLGGETFKVELDTGSSALAVPQSGCEFYSSKGDDEGMCNTAAITPQTDYYTPGQAAYRLTCADTSYHPYGCHGYAQCENAPPTQDCVWGVAYGTGASGMHGYIYSDILTIGHLSARTLFLATTVEKVQAPNGIFGISYNAPSLEGYYDGTELTAVLPASLDGFLAAHNLSNSFSLLSYSPGSGSVGTLTLGGIDPSLFVPPMHFRPLRAPYDFYHVTYGGFYLGGKKYAKQTYTKDVIIDSGTYLIALPTKAFNYFKNSFLAKYPGLPGNLPADKPGSVWINNNLTPVLTNLTSDQVNMWPDITFLVSGLYFTLPPTNYFRNLDQHNPHHFYFEFQAWPGTPFTILGSPFLQGMYVNHNRETNRVGFAQAVQKDGIRNPRISTVPPKAKH